MKTGVCFNLFRHLKKHFLFFIFSVMFIIYLSFILLVKEFFVVNTNSDTVINIIFLSVVIYFTLLGLYLTNYLYRILPNKKHWLIIAIKIIFCLLLAYLLYKYLVVLHCVFNELSDTFSYIWDVILNRSNIQTGSKKQLFNLAVFDIIILILTLQLFICIIQILKIEIKPVLVYFTEKKYYYSEYYFEIEVSLGFLYKALP